MKPIDYGLIKQIKILEQQAQNALSKLSELSGVRVSIETDNAGMVQLWRSTQTTELTNGKMRIITYNN